MKRKESRKRIRIFYGLLIVPTVLWVLLSVVGVAKHLDYDTGEKRNKHTIAEGTNLSNITTELETCYDDRVPFRSLMLSVNSTINWLIEIPYNKVIQPVLLHWANASLDTDPAQTAASSSGADPNAAADAGSAADGTAGDSAVSQDAAAQADQGDVSSDPNAAQTEAGTDPNAQAATLPVFEPVYETPTESGYYPLKELTEEVIQGRDGWLFTTESYMDFTGENMPSDETLSTKLSALDQLNQICQSKGIEFHVFAMPNKNTVYPEYMPSVEQAEYSALNAFEDYIHANSSVSFEFLDDEMLGAKKYGRLYYMYDTHWNNRGGLAAYAYMRNTLGLSPIDISTIGVVEEDPYYGDLAEYTGLPSANFETENAIEMQYKPEVTQQLVRGNDDYIDELVSQNTESDKTVVLIGDSYRHSLVPYLSRDYAHVYSLNEKQLSSEMTDILNSADIIILESVERNFFFETHYDTAVSDLTGLMQ